MGGEMFHVKQWSGAQNTFAEAAARVGLQLSDAQWELIQRAAEWLSSVGRASGLSGYDSPEVALLRGMGPALAYFALEAAPKAGKLADLGAGNGAIGATLAICSQNLRVDLVDRAQRAYTACEILVARLGIPNLRALCVDAATVTEGEYDALVFRALASGPRALMLAKSLVRAGGFIGAFHRTGDAAFERPPEGLERLGTRGTLVEGLAFTGYRN